MQRRNKVFQPVCRRRRLFAEQLEDRRLLAILDFLPAASAGTISEEGGKTVVTVAAQSNFSVSAQLVSVETTGANGYSLNLSPSSSQLRLNNWSSVGSPFSNTTDATLDSVTNDFSVSGGFASGNPTDPDVLPAPPTRLLGTFSVTAPSLPGDYTLTSNVAGFSGTFVTNSAGDRLPITDFGDLIVRVAGVPASPTVSLNLTSQTVPENSGTIAISVTLSSVSTTAVTVPFTVTGTATNGADYTITSSPITIAAGATTASIMVTMIDDAVSGEATETVIVTLGTPTGATVSGTTTHTLSISDNEVTSGLFLNLVPALGTGVITEESGKTVVTVTPNQSFKVTAELGSSLTTPVQVNGFALNFRNSSAELILKASNPEFQSGSIFTQALDSGLDSTATTPDYYVASAILGTQPATIPVPPLRLLGTINVTAPTAIGDYRLRQDFTDEASIIATSVLDVEGNRLPIIDLGELVVRVVGPTLPTVTFNAASQTVDEGVGTVTLTASLSTVSESAVTVPFTLAGSAVNTNDFTISGSPLTIPAGATSASVTVRVIDDAAIESSETVIVTLGTPTGASLGSIGSQTINIADNDVLTPPNLSLSVASQNVNENVGTFTVTANLSAASTSAITVPFTVTGTARNGMDFTIASASPLSIPAGATSGTIGFSVLDDALVELSESIIVTLGAPTGANLGSIASQTINIADNDVDAIPSVSLNLPSQNVNENVGTFTVTASLSAAGTSAITVPFTVTGTATNGTDFTIVSASPLSIPAGATSGTISFSVLDDALVELSESIIVTLGAPTGANLGSIASQTINIADNDVVTIPSVSLNLPSQIVNENIGTFTVTVNLSAAGTSAITVPFTVTGTATNGTDFTIVSASPLSIPAGATSGTISFMVVDDALVELSETVIVTLGAPTGANLGEVPLQVVTIVNNDGQPSDRIVRPNLVARPHAIPGDGRSTAIIFHAIIDTTVSIYPIKYASVTETVRILNVELQQVSSYVQGVATADVVAGGLYAIIFEPQTSNRFYTVRSSAGYQALGNSPSNVFDPTDTNADGNTTATDALIVINQLSADALSAEGESVQSHLSYFTDVNRDGQTTALDALMVINHLNLQDSYRLVHGEGEVISTNFATPNLALKSVSTVSDDVFGLPQEEVAKKVVHFIHDFDVWHAGLISFDTDERVATSESVDHALNELFTEIEMEF